MKKLFTLCVFVVLSATLTAQQPLITKQNTPIDQMPGAPFRGFEGGIYIFEAFDDGPLIYDFSVLKGRYVYNNIYVAGGIGAMLSFYNNMEEDDAKITQWLIGAQVPIVAGARLGFLDVRMGPCLNYTLMGGGKMFGERYTLSDLDTKRTYLSFDFGFIMYDVIGLKVKLGKNLEQIGLGFFTTF